jgi:hypothetical protein
MVRKDRKLKNKSNKLESNSSKCKSEIDSWMNHYGKGDNYAS